MNRRKHSSRAFMQRSGRVSGPSAIIVAALLLPLLTLAQQSPSQPEPAVSPSTSSAAEAVGTDGYQLQPGGFYLNRWPNVRFDFNLLNEAHEPFDELNASDVQATFDDRPVEIKENALHLTSRDPAHAIVLLDGSLSMVAQHRGVKKLEAARAALLSFNRSLGSEDTLSVYAFDEGLYPVSKRGNDKALHEAQIRSFEPRLDRDLEGVRYSDSTDLYGAVTAMLQQASKEDVRNLIVVSDGMQDTSDAREALSSDDEFENYKHGREKTIRDAEQTNGVRVFTIAIGDKDSRPRHPDNLNYVDDDTLLNITNENAGAYHEYVSLPELSREATTTEALQRLLEAKLKTSFEKIRQSIRYGYSLDLTLNDFPRDGREHTLAMYFHAGQNVLPAVKYPMYWSGNDPLPQLGRPVVFAAVFLAPPKLSVTPISLGAIYLTGLSALGVLALIPLLLVHVQRASRAKAQERAVSTSVFVVQKNSPYVGQQCPNDPSKLIDSGDTVVICPRCGRAHHLECWLYVKSRCMVRYCAGELPIPEPVRQQYGIRLA